MLWFERRRRAAEEGARRLAALEEAVAAMRPRLARLEEGQMQLTAKLDALPTRDDIEKLGRFMGRVEDEVHKTLDLSRAANATASRVEAYVEQQSLAIARLEAAARVGLAVAKGAEEAEEE